MLFIVHAVNKPKAKDGQTSAQVASVTQPNKQDLGRSRLKAFKHYYKGSRHYVKCIPCTQCPAIIKQLSIKHRIPATALYNGSLQYIARARQGRLKSRKTGRPYCQSSTPCLPVRGRTLPCVAIVVKLLKVVPSLLRMTATFVLFCATECVAVTLHCAIT